MTGLPEQIEGRIREAVASRDLILLQLLRRGSQNSSVVEVIVDSLHGAVDLEALTSLSREINAIFDENEEAIKGRYRLDVSTAGLDRPLEHDWQYRKNLGRLVKVTFDDEKGKTTQIFRLIGLEENGLRLEKAQTGKGKARVKAGGVAEPVVIPLDRIDKVVVEPEF